MAVVSSSVEIVEAIEEVNSKSEMDEATSSFLLDSESKYSIEDDINRLFESLNVRSSHRTSGLSRDAGRDSLRKNPSKRPMRGGSSPASGIGISEPVSLKQALRGLCISQASEMAAMKRLPKPTNLSSISEAGNIKRLYRAMVVEAGKSGHPLNEGKANVVEISLLPEKIASSSSAKVSDSTQKSCTKLSHQNIPPPPTAEAVTAEGTMDGLTPLAPALSSPIDPGSYTLKSEGGNAGSLESSSVNHGSQRVSDANGFALPAADIPLEHLGSNNGHKGKLPLPSSLSCSTIGNTGTKATLNSPRLFRPVFGNKNLIKKKLKHESCSASSSHNRCMEKVNSESDKSNLESNCVLNNEGKEDGKTSLASSSAKQSNEVSSTFMSMGINKPFSALTCSNGSKSFCKADEKSRPRDKGDFSQSSKSSIGEYSSSTSISETSNASSSSSFGNRPHMSKDLRWEAIQSVQKQHGNISLRHFKLLKRLGSGDIGKIYLAELIGTDCLFALKLMDNEFLVTRKKMPRAQTEKDIMQMLDHPFLPTLYCHFSTDKLSGLVMEYCPGGDLHVLRQKQPARSFSEQAARFYVAEVLLALEYLHMLGVVYRDLKPENILVREDGHIMLSDFDLSLRCAVNPTLVAAASPDVEREPTRKSSSPCTESSCVDPFCLNPSFQVPCFTPRLLSVGTRSRKMKSDLASQNSSLPQVVVEPTSARSNSFVGTHEYIAPEIIKVEGHGSAVDWWTFGILLYELLYGRTPFKGSGNEETLSNVVSRSLKFPSNPVVSFHARDLIRGLLIKEPENRLGSVRGAAEIKQHPFFEGLNWALIRCAVPPEMPKLNEVEISAPSSHKETRECKETQQTLEHVEFEVF